MEDPRKLRALAGWYREFAERAGNPVIWEARLRTAKDLEHEADRLEKLGVRNGRFKHRSETGGVRHEVRQPLRWRLRAARPRRQ